MTYNFTEEGTYIFTAEAYETEADEPGVTATRTIFVAQSCSLVVVINSPPDGTTVPVGEVIAFSPAGAGGTGPYTYSWDFGESGVPDSNEEFPLVTFMTHGVFTVTVTITDALGQTSTGEITIEASSGLSADAPITFVDGMVWTPPNFGGSSTPDGGAMLFGNEGAVLFNPSDLTFGSILPPDGITFHDGLVATPDGGPHAIVGYNVNQVFVSYYDEGLGQFGAPVMLPTESGKDIAMFNNDPTSDGGLLVVSDGSGTLSQLWYFDGVEGTDAELIETLGNRPSQLRCLDKICVVIDKTDDNCSVITWDQSNNVNVVGSFPTGESPRGCELTLLGNGNYGFAATGHNTDTVTVAEIAPDGTVLMSDIRDMPLSCGHPADVVWLGNGGTDFVVTCLDGNDVYIIPSGL